MTTEPDFIPNTQITREQAAEGGRRGSATRRKRREMKADALAKHKFDQAAADMAQVIIDAARGHGPFARLAAKDRAQFALRALEYGIGRPRPIEAPEPEQGRQGEPGLSFTVGARGAPVPEAKTE